MGFKMNKKGFPMNSPSKNYKNPRDYRVFNMGNEADPPLDMGKKESGPAYMEKKMTGNVDTTGNSFQQDKKKNLVTPELLADMGKLRKIGRSGNVDESTTDKLSSGFKMKDGSPFQRNFGVGDSPNKAMGIKIGGEEIGSGTEIDRSSRTAKMAAYDQNERNAAIANRNAELYHDEWEAATDAMQPKLDAAEEKYGGDDDALMSSPEWAEIERLMAERDKIYERPVEGLGEYKDVEYTGVDARDEEKRRRAEWAADNSAVQMKSPVKRTDIDITRDGEEVEYMTDINKGGTEIKDDLQEALRYEQINENIVEENEALFESEIEDLESQRTAAMKDGNHDLADELNAQITQYRHGNVEGGNPIFNIEYGGRHSLGKKKAKMHGNYSNRQGTFPIDNAKQFADSQGIGVSHAEGGGPSYNTKTGEWTFDPQATGDKLTIPEQDALMRKKKATREAGADK